MSQTALAKSSSLENTGRTPTDPISTAASATEKKRGGSVWKKLIFFAALIAAAPWGMRTVQRQFTHAETDNAYVTGHVHQITSHVGGTIAEVLADENTLVKPGDILFRLDPRDHQAKLQQAEAQLVQSDAVVAFTEAQIVDTHAKVDQAQAQFTKAHADFQRTQELVKTKALSSQEFDAAKATLDSARAGLASAQAAAKGMESGLLVAKAQRQNSQSALENARLQLSYNTIVAPNAGRTSKRNAEVGAYVQPGQTLIAIVEPEVWIEANFKETQLAKMKINQQAEITIDALPGHTFTGIVESFSPASGA